MEQLAFPWLEWQVAVKLEPQPYCHNALGLGMDWEWSEGRGSSAVATRPSYSYDTGGVYYNACPFKVGDRAAGGVIESIRLVQTPSEAWFWVLTLGWSEPDDLKYAWRDLGVGKREVEWRDWWQAMDERFEVRARNAIIEHTRKIPEYPYLTLEYSLEGKVEGLVLDGEWGAFWPPPDQVRALIPPEALKIVNDWYKSEMV